MTKAGYIFIGAGLVVYLVASQTQVGWLYLFDAIIWSLLIISALLPGFLLKPLRVEQQLLLPDFIAGSMAPGGPFEDDAVEIRIRLKNSGRFTRYFINLLAGCPFEEDGKRQRRFIVAAVGGRSSTTFSFRATCFCRGHYAYSDITLQSAGPLGLVARRRVFRLPLNLTIYPKYYPMETLQTSGEEWAEWGRGVRSPAASEFYGSREYQYGEPLKHIHWRNTARLGSFMLKEYEQASRGPLSVIFDSGLDVGEGRETTLEYSIRTAASLAKLCAESGRSLDIITGGAYLHNAGWGESMEFLARLAPTEKDTTVEPMAAIGAGQTAIIIVPAAENAITARLGQLGGWGGRTVVVLLEDFAEDEKPDDVLSIIKRHNFDLVRCQRGNIELAISSLSDYLSRRLEPAAGDGRL